MQPVFLESKCQCMWSTDTNNPADLLILYGQGTVKVKDNLEATYVSPVAASSTIVLILLYNIMNTISPSFSCMCKQSRKMCKYTSELFLKANIQHLV